jgi:hypothetical protein
MIIRLFAMSKAECSIEILRCDCDLLEGLSGRDACNGGELVNAKAL